ncbi:MAG: hypothetical protein A2Y45_08205 [Tenericutes bacterium GWC2_34_14]|nr:MAG: hypothetical protein A2Z84_03270 [Tenericutes bacterium GWA2_35_7]OHE29878.1 MAG: hypothetical protein A2Y45_08205 [Tenericutes bacterium GWC2_34_14]OHE34857.1 MAG: hypothetical protein A2012_01815 [Tenericutes bacterium GWE2_34_108]OHE37282.1 MAG: hypothetical protein A2Y46_01195 [Tenericutes bacterium GWF1_35_14]OHE39585.1 MAG: hypothetical protein A2Y44_01665 [Tenericutes bacterium GWF2_35_184]OHE41287.1 MAG: hypothetical protein A3K26_06300 [Tenericutes bacterium RIFOXYA12_FULL_35_
MNEVMEIKINDSLTLELPLIKTNKFSYYSFNMLGMSKWNRIIGIHLYELIKRRKPNIKIDAIVTVESKAIGLAQVISELYGIDQYIIFRKSKKSYMINPIEYKSTTIISGECSYWIDSNELESLANKNILFLDDVISTGGTLNGVLKALSILKLKPVLIACVFTEKYDWQIFDDIEVISCGHLPIITGEFNHDR